MKTKDLLSACSVFVVAVSFATSSLALNGEEPDEPDDPIGCLSSECEEPDDPKGNNGWGNGVDGTNPGSDAGPPSQVETKNNREIWDKFEGKFEGR